MVIAIGFLLYVVFFKPFVPIENANTVSNINSGLVPASGNANIRVLPNINGTLPLAGNINNGNENANAETGPVGGVETIPTPKNDVFPLSPNAVRNPALSLDGNSILYYENTSGKFYTLGSSGERKPFSDTKFYEVEKVTWSPKKDKAILEYPDGSNIVYDFNQQKQISLPNHWEDFSFSQEGDKIISKSIGMNKENNFLIITDSSGTKTKIIQRLGDNGARVIPAWSPNNQMVAFFVGDSGLDQQEIYFIGQNDENFKSMMVEGWGFQGKWTPQGDKILYSVYNSDGLNKPELWVVDASINTIGRNRTQIKLETWADKCAFYDNTTVYCAVPNELQEGSGMLPSELDNSADTIYKINLNTGTKTQVAVPEEDHTMQNLMVSSDGKEVYFTDKKDGRLYKIPLQP